MDAKTITLIIGMILSGGGTLTIYADNGELRGDIKVLNYKISSLKENQKALEAELSKALDAEYECSGPTD